MAKCYKFDIFPCGWEWNCKYYKEDVNISPYSDILCGGSFINSSWCYFYLPLLTTEEIQESWGKIFNG